MSCVAAHNICRTRADTYAELFQLKLNGVPVDITGHTLLLTVDPSETPADDTNNLFQLTAVLVTPVQGIFSFAPDAAQADQTPSVYFYDVQWDDGTSIRTVLRGQWEVTQDITKNT